MPKFNHMLILVSACLGVSAIFARPAENPGSAGSLKAFLAVQGFAGASMERRFGNHLFVATNIDGRRTRLLVDTGAPVTVIDKDSVKTLGLQVRKTDIPVGGVYGWKSDRAGIAKLDRLAMGNCTFVNVPVIVADESEMNYYNRISHVDGLFGAHEMQKFGAVIDCARQMIYINPRGPDANVSQKLATFLSGRGFTRVPMHFNQTHHCEVDATLNGHPVLLTVDTGAGNTHIAQQVALSSGVTPAKLPARGLSGNGQFVPLSGGRVKELAVGDFKINDAEVVISTMVGALKAGLLGEEYLSWNFAVIDMGSMTLYLRHPDPR